MKRSKLGFGQSVVSSLLAVSLLMSCATWPAKRNKPQIETSDSALPEGFSYLQDKSPSILEEMRYAGDHNFIGGPIPGYLAPRCILTTRAAEALAEVQRELQEYSMSLKVYDCYRPQKAVDHFVSWAKDISDHKMKKEFYPKVDKTQLFKDGYIAEKSGHSRGSTVDLTIVALPLQNQPEYKDGDSLVACSLPKEKRFRDNTLDFGTGFDCFDPLAHTANPNIGPVQKQRRVMLKALMEKHGFKNLPEEWWHYTLRNEPFSESYFDFDVK